MRTIAIFNLKGGVAKTMTTAALADILAIDHKKRVLVIDADGQGNLSQYYGVKADEGNSLLALLQGEHEAYYPDFVTAARPGVDMIPADMHLMFADVDAIKDGRCDLNAIEDLRLAIEEDNSDDGENWANGYDYLLIDCPPAFSAASTAALTAADEVIIPVRLDAFSTAGMAELMAQVENMRRINERLRVSGILVTQYQHTAEEDGAARYLAANSNLPVYRTKIRMSPKVGAATFAREPLITFSPHCGAAKDYRRFARELLEQEGGGRYGR